MQGSWRFLKTFDKTLVLDQSSLETLPKLNMKIISDLCIIHVQQNDPKACKKVLTNQIGNIQQRCWFGYPQTLFRKCKVIKSSFSLPCKWLFYVLMVHIIKDQSWIISEITLQSEIVACTIWGHYGPQDRIPCL